MTPSSLTPGLGLVPDDVTIAPASDPPTEHTALLRKTLRSQSGNYVRPSSLRHDSMETIRNELDDEPMSNRSQRTSKVLFQDDSSSRPDRSSTLRSYQNHTYRIPSNTADTMRRRSLSNTNTSNASEWWPRWLQSAVRPRSST